MTAITVSNSCPVKMLGILGKPEFAMTKPSNERRELHRSTHELRATELDAVNGGSWFKYLSDILKGQSDTLKSIAQNLR